MGNQSIRDNQPKPSALAESALNSVNKFIDSISEDDTEDAVRSLMESTNGRILAMLPMLITVQALVIDGILDKDDMARIVSYLADNIKNVDAVAEDSRAIRASQIMMNIFVKRINDNHDLLTGKKEL